MITREEYLKGRDKEFPLSLVQIENMRELLRRINTLRHYYGKPMIVSSGYRPAALNSKVGGAKQSRHITCQAIDILDKGGSFADWCIKNIDKLELCDLWLEHPAHTAGWVHLQSTPPKSGNRIFTP